MDTLIINGAFGCTPNHSKFEYPDQIDGLSILGWIGAAGEPEITVGGIFFSRYPLQIDTSN